MKPDDIILGQFYVIDEIDNEPPNLTAFLRGTNRVVRIVSRDTHNPHRFYAEHYGYPIYSDWIKCWVPGVGEKAMFWNDIEGNAEEETMRGYLCGQLYPFVTFSSFMGTMSYKNCKPLPKEATPVPDRNQTFELAELGAMQEEKIATDDDWRGAIDIKLDDLTKRLDAVEAKDIRAVAHDELLAILFKNWNKTAMPVNPFYARTTDDKGL